MSEVRDVDALSAWASLKHGGLLLAPSRLSDVFPDTMPMLPWKTSEHLRRAVIELNDDGRVPSALMDTVLEEVLGLGVPLETHTGQWLKGNTLGPDWTRKSLTGEPTKPQRVWQGDNGAELPVFVDTERRIGIGRGRRMPARVAEWLRATDRPLALLTNGRQWRLIHTALDSEAFAEWDTSLWFEEGEPGPQVSALRALLDRERLTPMEEAAPSPLLAAITASRKGQGELSAILGERVRQAVELLIRRVFSDLDLPCDLEPNQSTQQQIYRAATRVVMRMVVVLFAEARDDLLPRSNPIYHLSYGLQGLREALQQAGAGTKDGLARLAHRHSAWPRVLSLFRLVYLGSPHKDLTLPRYGGGLFEPGDAASSDTLRRALSALEDAARGPSDADVYRILELLCVTEMRVRQGTAFTRAPVPVDFSDLSSEYIGILYEGLLDYELRRADEGDPIVFLNLGDQPALPLSRLESMEDKALAGLVEKLKVKRKAASDEEAESEDEASEEDEGEEVSTEEAENEARDAATPDDDEPEDARREAEEQAHQWARRAVEAGKIVKKPKSKKKDAIERHEAEIEVAAKALIARTVLPGEWFLVRWGGIRKGAGTFYTRPALAVPTAQRTLRPLAYDPPRNADGEPNEDALASEWTPKKPEEILSLKVCDPAMGSASFLVASLRFLTDALFASLHHHGRIAAQGEKTLVTLAEGKPSEGKLVEETLPCAPDDETFQSRLRAILKRYVVERCLYGVDIDPLAVELGRLALWVETLDRDLPFEFLDHKLKVGNSLVGCWFDRFRDYPVLAWEREAGDKNHTNAVHYEKGAWTNLIKELRNGEVKRELIDLIEGQITIDATLTRSPEELQDEASAAIEAMHELPVFDADTRATSYRDNLRDNPALNKLRTAFDAWCSVWFWPAAALNQPLTPKSLGRLGPEQEERVRHITAELRFFHWEIEFPDVFSSHRRRPPQRDYTGFDAVVGNPPWETLQPNSREYFSNLDPLYRTYGAKETDKRQRDLFRESEALERAWVEYNAGFKALANWQKHAASPFGDGSSDGRVFNIGRDSDQLHERWQTLRGRHTALADPRHPFRHQGGGKPYTYKMFLEQAHALLRTGGKLGMIIPSGLYADPGAGDLRSLLLRGCDWQWLFSFENRQKIFDIDSRFKFGPIIFRKGGSTTAIRAAFMRHDLADWIRPEPYLLQYSVEAVSKFSPTTAILVELESARDYRALSTAYSNAKTLGGYGADRPFSIQRLPQGDLNLTADRGHVLHKTSPEVQRGEIDGFGRLLNEGRVVANPVYQGAMIHQMNPLFGHYEIGFGHKTRWKEANLQGIGAQFWAPLEFKRRELGPKARLISRRLINATNARSMIASIIPDYPSSDTTLVWELARESLEAQLLLAAALNSLVFDWIARLRLAGATGATALDIGRLQELPVPTRLLEAPLVPMVAQLNLCHQAFAQQWLDLRERGVVADVRFAVTPSERLRLRCILDAALARLFGFDYEDLVWVLRGCDHPVGDLRSKSFTRTLNPKGFWRIDQREAPELRHTVLTLVAFHDLATATKAEDGDPIRGIARFVSQNRGEGWMLPEAVRLSDYGLGRDERARRAQPVRERLGERFRSWQTSRSADEAWGECEVTARKMAVDASRPASTEEESQHPDVHGPPRAVRTATKTSDHQGELFGGVRRSSE